MSRPFRKNVLQKRIRNFVDMFEIKNRTAKRSCFTVPCGARETVSRVLYLTVIYLDAPLPVRSSHPGSGRASLCAPIPVLLRIEFTASDCSQPMGALLPHLSTLTGTAQPNQRYISVALFLKSPSAGVTRYPCPVEPGLSSWTAFRPAHATVCFPRGFILPEDGVKVNCFPKKA